MTFNEVINNRTIRVEVGKKSITISHVSSGISVTETIDDRGRLVIAHLLKHRLYDLVKQNEKANSS